MADVVNARLKKETLVWTDDEVELLLQIILDYKTAKFQENVDWESCPSKYSDIMDAFQAQYPRHPTDKDFPHDDSSITKAQVTAKVKNIRGKYKQAVETGCRSGQGRVVLLFFELCEEIWGRPPGTRPLDAGIETEDLLESSSRQSWEVSPDSPRSIESFESPPPAAVKPRRDTLQAKVNGHRGNRRELKRKPPTDFVQEDLQIKRRMLKLMEESNRRNAESWEQINTNIANITSVIQEGFSLMRTLLLQPQNTPQPAFVQISTHAIKQEISPSDNTSD